MAYKAKHDSAMLNSILYLSCVLMFVLLPITGVVLEIARKGGRINTAFFILYLADSTCKCTTPQSYKIFS